MKKKHLFLRGKTYGWLLSASVLMFGACTDAIEPESWNPGVSNTTLAAPEITAYADADGNTVLSWPVVYGAGGFQMSLYDITDTENPITMVTDTIIDGSTCTFPRAEDSNYKLLVKTLGNEKYNNKESEEIEFFFTSLVPKIHEEPIPAGTDLTAWLQEKQSVIDAQTEEWAVELTCGETYYMNGSFYMGNLPFTLRSSNKNGVPPTIIMGESGGFITENGVNIKNLNFDCSQMTDKKSGIVIYPSSPTIEANSGYYIIGYRNPVIIKNCKIKGLQSNLIYDNGKKWAVYTQKVDNCIIELDQKAMSSNGTHVYANAGGFCFDAQFLNSTIYSTTQGNKSFLITYSSIRPNQICNGTISPTNNVIVNNSTFVNVSYGNYIVNYGRLAGQSMCHLTIDKSLFLDCSNDRVARGFMANGNDNMSWSITTCCFWFNGKEGDTGRPKGEDHVNEDPMLTQSEEGYYIVGNPSVKAAGIGDPRGLQ